MASTAANLSGLYLVAVIVKVVPPSFSDIEKTLHCSIAKSLTEIDQTAPGNGALIILVSRVIFVVSATGFTIEYGLLVVPSVLIKTIVYAFPASKFTVSSNSTVFVPVETIRPPNLTPVRYLSLIPIIAPGYTSAPSNPVLKETVSDSVSSVYNNQDPTRCAWLRLVHPIATILVGIYP